MRLYHYTPKGNVKSILTNGLYTGYTVRQGEKIDAILTTTEVYEVHTGNLAYLVIELPIDYTAFHFINDSWVECYTHIEPKYITAIAYPPDTNQEVIDIFLHDGQDELNKRFEYIPTSMFKSGE